MIIKGGTAQLVQHISYYGVVATVALAGLLCSAVSVDAQGIQINDIRMTPYQEILDSNGKVRRVEITPSSDGYYHLSKREVIGLEPIETPFTWLNQPSIHDVVDIQGLAPAGAVVTLKLIEESGSSSTAGLFLETQADDEGHWLVTLPVDTVEPGVYTAALTPQMSGEKGPSEVIASFSIYARRDLSRLTWWAVILGGTMIILSLIGANLYFYYSRKREDNAYIPPVLAEDDPDTHIAMGDQLESTIIQDTKDEE